MFGKDKLLSEGAPAKGVVIETHGPATSGQGGVVDSYRLVVRVKFDDGSTTEFAQKLNHRKDGLHIEGDIVPVRFDPADHSKIEIDLPALAARREAARSDAKQAAIARSERALDPQGAPPDDPSDDRRSLLQTSIRIAERKGDTAQIERLTAQLAALDGAGGGAPNAPG
jgi:hypothetical protein